MRRYRHEPPIWPRPDRTCTPKLAQPLRAKRPNDLWFLDITQVKALFGFPRFRVAGVLDAFSRMPLAVSVSSFEPTADDLGGLLKAALHLPLFRPLTESSLEERLGYAVLHYTFFRPHRTLVGRTSAEAFFGWPAAHERATSPPRGVPGQPSPPSPFQIHFLDPQQTYAIPEVGVEEFKRLAAEAGITISMTPVS